jgi:hypothetical protein
MLRYFRIDLVVQFFQFLLVDVVRRDTPRNLWIRLLLSGPDEDLREIHRPVSVIISQFRSST